MASWRKWPSFFKGFLLELPINRLAFFPLLQLSLYTTWLRDNSKSGSIITEVSVIAPWQYHSKSESRRMTEKPCAHRHWTGSENFVNAMLWGRCYQWGKSLTLLSCSYIPPLLLKYWQKVAVLVLKREKCSWMLNLNRKCCLLLLKGRKDMLLKVVSKMASSSSSLCQTLGLLQGASCPCCFPAAWQLSTEGEERAPPITPVHHEWKLWVPG